MEEPNTRVVGLEPNNQVSIWMQNKSVTSHWDCWVIGLRGVGSIKDTSLICCADKGLEVVTVEMEGMLSAV